MELFRKSSLFALFLLFDMTSALYFHIAEAERKCFIEEIPDDTTVIVDYKLELYDPRSGCFMPPNPGTGMHVEVRDPNDKVLFSRVYSSEGLLSFTSDTPGEYFICMHSNSTSSFNGSQFIVHLDFQVGVQAVDFANIAVKYNLTVLELRARQLLNQVYQITKEQQSIVRSVSDRLQRAQTSECCGGVSSRLECLSASAAGKK